MLVVGQMEGKRSQCPPQGTLPTGRDATCFANRSLLSAAQPALHGGAIPRVDSGSGLLGTNSDLLANAAAGPSAAGPAGASLLSATGANSAGCMDLPPPRPLPDVQSCNALSKVSPALGLATQTMSQGGHPLLHLLDRAALADQCPLDPDVLHNRFSDTKQQPPFGMDGHRPVPVAKELDVGNAPDVIYSVSASDNAMMGHIAEGAAAGFMPSVGVMNLKDNPAPPAGGSGGGQAQLDPLGASVHPGMLNGHLALSVTFLASPVGQVSLQCVFVCRCSPTTGARDI